MLEVFLWSLNLFATIAMLLLLLRERRLRQQAEVAILKWQRVFAECKKSAEDWQESARIWKEASQVWREAAETYQRSSENWRELYLQQENNDDELIN